MGWQALFSEMDRAVFQDRVVASVQRDGQKVLDAAVEGDVAKLKALAIKYTRDIGLSLGGGGAGPGKVKTARPGAAAVGKLAYSALDRLAAA